MATVSQKDIQLLMIGQDAAKSTGGINTLNDGEIGIFTPSGTRLTEASAATAPEFMIVKKTPNGGVPLVSSTIRKNKIKSCKASLYVAATNQVSYIGFNGTSGAITVANDNKYHIRFNIIQGLTSNHGGLYIKHAFYTSDSSATQFEIAHNLLKAASVEFSKEADKVLKTEMLSDDAGAALGGAATLTVSNGSKYIVASSGAHGLVPGDAVRIGGTAITDPVYVVDTVNGTQIKLTTFYAGTSATGVAGEELTSLAGNFGLKFTGLPQPHRVGKIHQDLQALNVNITLEGFGASPYSTTVAKSGNGTEKQIKELEWFLQGNEGDFLRVGEPNLFPARAEATGNYDLIDIEIEEVSDNSIVMGPIYKRYTLAIPQTTPAYALSGTADDITDVLEVLVFGAVNGSLNL